MSFCYFPQQLIEMGWWDPSLKKNTPIPQVKTISG